MTQMNLFFQMRLFEEYKLVKSGCYIQFINGADLYEGKRKRNKK